MSKTVEVKYYVMIGDLYFVVFNGNKDLTVTTDINNAVSFYGSELENLKLLCFALEEDEIEYRIIEVSKEVIKVEKQVIVERSNDDGLLVVKPVLITTPLPISYLYQKSEQESYEDDIF